MTRLMPRGGRVPDDTRGSRAAGALAIAAVAVAVLVAAVVAACGAGASSSTVTRPEPGAFLGSGGCPRARALEPRAAEGALRALRRAVPHTWRIVNQSGEVHLSPKHYSIESLQRLALYDDVREEGRSIKYGRLVRKLCGRVVAGSSYVAIVRFPDATVTIAALGIALLARTRSGWVVWYKVR